MSLAIPPVIQNMIDKLRNEKEPDYVKENVRMMLQNIQVEVDKAISSYDKTKFSFEKKRKHG